MEKCITFCQKSWCFGFPYPYPCLSTRFVEIFLLIISFFSTLCTFLISVAKLITLYLFLTKNR